MQFKDSTNNTGIADDIDFLCDTDDTSYPLKDKARNANRWLYRAVVWTFESSPLWEFDDTNLSTLPIARTTLVAGQEDYSLPSDMLRVQKVTVLDSSSNEHEVTLLPFDEYKAFRMNATQSTGIPSRACLRGASIFLDPAPASGQVTLSNGLRLYISREIDAFASTDTTQEAGIPEPFHRIVSLGAAHDYWLKYDPNKANALLAQIMDIKRDLLKFNASRVEDLPPAIRPVIRTRQYR